MDDISEKLSQLLSSEDGMEKLKSAASSLLGGIQSGGGKEGDGAPDMAGLLQAAKAMAGGGNDPRVKLLLALKPHLSEERGKRVDKAVKILQLVSLAPLLSESGIL